MIKGDCRVLIADDHEPELPFSACQRPVSDGVQKLTGDATATKIGFDPHRENRRRLAFDGEYANAAHPLAFIAGDKNGTIGARGGCRGTLLPDPSRQPDLNGMDGAKGPRGIGERPQAELSPELPFPSAEPADIDSQFKRSRASGEVGGTDTPRASCWRPEDGRGPAKCRPANR